MRNLIKKSILYTAIAVLVVSCSNDDSNNNNDDGSNSAQEVTLIAQAGTWRITYFWDSDKEETDNFTGYVFDFKENGTLTATRNNNTISGTWSVIDDSSNSSSDDDGNSTDDDDFNIFFSVPADSDFDDLIDDWDIISVSANKIELTDVSGGNGGIDFLTFERN